MFDGFQDEKDTAAKKRWFASASASAVVYVAIGGIVMALAGKTVHRSITETPIDVTFHAAPEEKPALDAKEASTPGPLPPPQRAGKGKRPGKRTALVEPTKLSDQKLEEVEPTSVAPSPDEDFLGDGSEETPLPAASPPSPPPVVSPPRPPEPPRFAGPIEEADEVTPPIPVDENVLPTYPEEMRRKGIESTVVLKVRISEAGSVVSVELLRGEEPFATAAMAAVRAWRYRPAEKDGRAVAFTRIVKIPFRLRS